VCNALIDKVPIKKGERWCHQKSDIKYFETSAKDNTSLHCLLFYLSLDVEQAFLEIARIGLSREVVDEGFYFLLFEFLFL
jgi:hypothetical protein